jgi:hypothetical protein
VDLKARVRERFGIEIEEEVQYVGDAGGSGDHFDAEPPRR